MVSRSIIVNKTAKYTRKTGSILLCLFGIVGCAAMVPYVPLAVELGSNLLVAASGNYSGKYSELVGSAVNTLTGRPQAFNAQADQDQSGLYVEPAPLVESEQVYQEQPYLDQDIPEQTYQEQAYQEPPYSDQSTPTQTYSAEDYQAYEGQAYVDLTAVSAQESEVLPTENGYMPLSSGAISLDVSILRQTVQGTVASIEDGAVLNDGRGRSVSQSGYTGDRFKIAFRANCNCYVYIVSADATGQMTLIFPHADDAYANPVQVGMSVEIPRSRESSWYGLDEFRGVETIYFVASSARRADLEQVLEQLQSAASEGINKSPSDFIPVTQPYLVTSATVTRGLPTSCVQMDIGQIQKCIVNRGIIRLSGNDAQQYNLSSGGEMAISVQAGQRARITPETFMINQGGTDLVFTRWFRHE